ncbi:MAG TPA: STAS domain-containing protein [Ilumatobacteraceae bacterium]|nr:STAS domain-containing protein [Ilumatobacteraceae bacterium]
MIHVTGDLDLSTRDLYMSVATAGDHPAVVIDLAGCTFMDCSGYGSLVASRRAIEGDGRSLTITGQTGQPARLWKLIADVEIGHRDEP